MQRQWRGPNSSGQRQQRSAPSGSTLVSFTPCAFCIPPGTRSVSHVAADHPVCLCPGGACGRCVSRCQRSVARRPGNALAAGTSLKPEKDAEDIRSRSLTHMRTLIYLGLPVSAIGIQASWTGSLECLYAATRCTTDPEPPCDLLFFFPPKVTMSGTPETSQAMHPAIQARSSQRPSLASCVNGAAGGTIARPVCFSPKDGSHATPPVSTLAFVTGRPRRW